MLFGMGRVPTVQYQCIDRLLKFEQYITFTTPGYNNEDTSMHEH